MASVSSSVPLNARSRDFRIVALGSAHLFDRPARVTAMVVCSYVVVNFWCGVVLCG